MNRFWKIAGIAALVLTLAAASVAVVGAQAPETTEPSTMLQRIHQAIADALGITVEKYDEALSTARQKLQDEGVDLGRWEHMEGMGGGRRGGSRGGSQSLVGVAATQLGLTQADLVAELEAGKTIAQLAQAKGVELQSIVDAYLELRTATLDRAVELERMTREEADEKLATMEAEVREHLEEAYPWECDSGDCTGHMEGGTMGPRGHMNNGTQDSESDTTLPGRGFGMMGRGSW